MSKIRPEFAKAQTLLQAGEITAADAALRKALKRHPKDIYGRFLRGTIDYHKRSFTSAIKKLEQVVLESPTFIDALTNLGSAYSEVGQQQAAVECYERVLALDPKNYVGLNNLGGVLKKQKRYAEAQEVFARAITVRPDAWLARYNLGGTYFERKKYAEAVDEFKAALKDRSDPRIYASLISVLRFHDPDEAFELSRKVAGFDQPDCALLAAFPVLVESCDWDLVHDILPKLLQFARTTYYPLQGILLPLNKVPGVSAEILFELHKTSGKRTMEHVRQLPKRDMSTEGRRPLRIGYMSPDFREHSVGYFIRNLMKHHNREHFQLFCYSSSRVSDDITAEIRLGSHSFASIYNLTDEALAAKVRTDGIDIVIDLSGHTADSRVAALCYRPAPVQMTYLGYPNTTGLPSVDYRISDAESESQQGTHYTEQLLFMPESFLCFGEFLERPLLQHTPARDSGMVTFGSFNNVNKLNPETIVTWARILNEVDNSRLLVKSSNAAKKRVKDNLYQAFAAHGVAAERIELAGFCADKAEHLDLYNTVDIALDTYPYNGTTTTCEALWMGVPVLTRRGELHASRVSAAILDHIGVEETIAADETTFVELAVQLANDLETLDRLRQAIPHRLRDSILCDPERFTRQFEDLLAETWTTKVGTLPWERADADTQELARDAQPIAVNIQGDVSVSVPNDLNLLTPYILLEQEDWFEMELKFVRRLLRPGMKVLDIGANYGIYSLTAGKMTGPEGRVWSFEPGSTTASYLRRSLKLNQLNNVELIEAGVSDQSGTARLSLHGNSELNAVLEGGDDADHGDSQTIRLLSLDDAMQEYQWPAIDFLKLDAEGFEEKILRGGQRFFAEHSPLVLYEIKHGAEWNLGLAECFSALGYSSYRLVPGLNILVPFDLEKDADPFLLNLFCCKPDRAEQLETQGLLCRVPLDPVSVAAPTPGTWVDVICRYPYAAQSLDRWLSFMQQHVDSKAWAVHQQALDFYCLAHQPQLAPDQRHTNLEAAYQLLGRLLSNDANLSNLQSFVRIAIEAGRWQPALDALDYMKELVGKETLELPVEPFLPVSDVFEWIEPGDDMEGWLKASVLERFEKMQGYSGYFSREESTELLAQIRALGFQSPEMERRRQLVALRCGKQAVPEAAPLLLESSHYNLNPSFWVN